MKNHLKLITIILSSVVALSTAGTVVSIATSYTKDETDSLISELRTSVDKNKSELQSFIFALESEYEIKNEQLLQAIEQNTLAISALKSEYQTTLAELKSADKENKEDIVALGNKYFAKVEELIANDRANAQALESFKAEYERKALELEAKDKENKDAIFALDNKYLAEIEKLVLADSANEDKLTAFKNEYQTQINQLNAQDKATSEALADLEEEYLSKVEELIGADGANADELAELKADYENKIADLNSKDEENAQAIAKLKEEYLAKLEQLQGLIEGTNAEELATLKADYESKVLELEAKDEENAQAIAKLKEAYLAKIEELIASDNENAQALATLKADYESKVLELNAKDEENAEEIAKLKEEYLVKVEELQGAIDGANKTIASNKTALENAINSLKGTYESKIAEIEGVIESLKTQNTNNAQIITALTDRIVELEKGLNITSVQFADNGDLILTFADGSSQTIKSPNKTEHNFGEWCLYSEERLYYRVCSSCSTVEWKQGIDKDHNWSVVTTAPTCQEEGYDTKTCSNCFKEEIDNYISITDHPWNTYYSYDTTFHWYNCATCGSTKDYAEHTVLNSDFCSVCGGLVGPTAGVEYDLSADGTYAEVIGYAGTAVNVRIAEEYQGKPVTTICNNAFENNNSIKSVALPNALLTIGAYAFSSCSSLSSVVIPDSVTAISEGAFYSCNNLQFNTHGNCEYLTSPTNSYFALIKGASANLSAIITHGHTEVIASGAFSNYSALSRVVIGDSITSIGDNAFYNCNLLTSVYYLGAESDWDNIDISTLGNNKLAEATRYYYTEIQPTEEGNYWHYVNGESTVWEILKKDYVTITYNYNYSGKNPSTVTVKNGQTLAYPTTPTRSDYAFRGWYLDSACTSRYNFSGEITEDFTLYAGWKSMSYSGKSETLIEAYKYPSQSKYYAGSTSNTYDYMQNHLYFVAHESGTHTISYNNEMSGTNSAYMLTIKNLTTGSTILYYTKVTQNYVDTIKSFTCNAGDLIVISYYRANTTSSSTDGIPTFYFSGFFAPTSTAVVVV